MSLVREGSPDETAPAAETAAPVTAAETAEAPEPGLPGLIPLPAELRDAGGVLWWSSVDCRAGALALSSGVVTRIPGERCRIWPSPDGAAAVTVTARRAAALEGRGLEYVTLDGERAVLRHTPGFIGSEVAWSDDGAVAAVCIGTRRGTVVDVFRAGAARPERLANRCVPAFLADGRLATSAAAPAAVEVAGRTVADAAVLARLLPTRPRGFRRAVSALSARGATLVAGLVAVKERRPLPASSSVAVVGADGRVAFTHPLYPAETLPAAVGLSPNGDALWYRDAGTGQAIVVAVPGGRRLSFFLARWIAWSPAGDYVAAATAGGISLRRWPSGVEVALVPVDAADVSWTHAP